MKKWFAAIAAVVAVAGVAGCGNDSKSSSDATTTVAPSTVTVTDDSGKDDTFLAQVKLIPSVTGSRSYLIEMGKNICKSYDLGAQTDALSVLNDEYGIEDAAKFMHASLSTYCPQHLAN